MHRKTAIAIIPLILISFAGLIACSDGGDDGANDVSLIGTWSYASSTLTIKPDSVTDATMSNFSFTLAKGAFAVAYTASSADPNYNAGPSSQSGTMSPEIPAPDQVISFTTMAGSGFWPGAGTVWYCKFTNVTSSTATISYSADNISWTGMGTFNKS
jgi:hypothetical protein